MILKKRLRDNKNESVDKNISNFNEVNDDQNQGATLLTREEHRLTRHGRYELDSQTRKLTSNGKTTRLKHRLNIAIGVLVMLIILTYIILLFL